MNLRATPEAVLIAIDEEDKPYVSRLNSALKGVASKVFHGKLVTLASVTSAIKKAGVYHVITTRTDFLKKLLPEDQAKKANINNYAGSIIEYQGVEFLFISPLKQLVSKTFGEFLATRYISKIVRPNSWRLESEFDWKLVDSEDTFQEAVSFLSTCNLIGVDTETIRQDAAIRCSGYCGLRLSDNKSFSYVVPLKSMRHWNWMKELNNIKIAKAMQNGKYDLAYFARFSTPPWGYYYDTATMLHSWYSELPKDLGSVSALLIRNSMYWKDLAETNDIMEYYKYNALDCWATVEAAVAWMLEAPQWAKENYKKEFTQIPIAHMCEMRGLWRNADKLKEVRDESVKKQDAILKELCKAAGHDNFNPGSSKQVTALLKVLGNKVTNADEKILTECATKHPLTDWFVSRILEYRGEAKLTSTYYTTGAKAKEFNGKILYALNPHGTDTGRFASKSHHFWCGLQVQNAPPECRDTLEADEGFELWEADYSQAEDRGVAFKSGDSNLLHIFASGLDSHKYKANMFFGVPYDEITDEIRKLGKRVNHGANYNMGAFVLLQTMGSVNVLEAKRLLNLKSSMSLLDVCKYLLFLYERAFPKVKSKYYASIKKEVRTTSKLVGDTGWTRYCFGNPNASKLALNAYVAHVTQSLSAMILNEAFLKVFLRLAFNPDFKLNAQIHDSILFQVRIGRDDLAQEVKELMTIPKQITDCEGTVRTMVVPVDLKRLGKTWGGRSE